MPTIDELSSQIAADLEFKAGGTASKRTSNPEGSFLESLGSAAGEYFLGAEPTAGANAFRAEHPWLGFGTEVAPALVGASASLKLKEAVPAFEKGVARFAEKGGNAFTKGAREAVAIMAPVEGLRLAGTALMNPENLGETAMSSAFNLGTEGLVGGLFRGMTAGGKVTPIDEPLPVGGDLKSPTQLQLRELKDRYTSGNFQPELKTKLEGQIADMETQVRSELVGDKPFTLDLANEGDGRDIARMFRDRGSKAGNIKVSRLLRSTSDFADDTEKLRVIKAAGLEGNYDAVQLPRHIGFTKDQWAKKVEDDFVKRGKMTALDDTTLYAKEKGGMYVMAKKITGKVGEAKAADEWVVFRTDQPGRFNPEVKDFADKMAARMAFLREDNLKFDPSKPATLMNDAKLAVSQSPIREFRDAHEKYGMLKKGSDKIAEQLGFAKGEGGSSFAASRAHAIVDQYLTPKLYQFKHSPVAKYVIGHADRTFAQAKYLADNIINGEAVSDAAKGFAKIFGEPSSTGIYKGLRAVKAIINSLDDVDLEKVREVADLVGGSDDAKKVIDELRGSGQISDKLHQALLDFDKHDELLVQELTNTQRAAGVADLNPLKGHLMLSRVWDGDYRAPIHLIDDKGSFVYVASGSTPQAADDLAKKIIAESGNKDLRFIPAERFDSMQDLKLAGLVATKSKEYGVLSAANSRIRTKPATFNERTGVEGYKTKFSKKELQDRLAAHLNDRYNYMARLSVDTSLEKQLTWLGENDPKTFAAVADRLRQMEGKQGAIGQFINNATDKLLKPALGRNSATKISGALNELVYHLQLGLGNMAFPALNAITFVQTVIPEAAFVMNAADNRVMREYYDVFLAGGSDMRPRGNVGTLSPMKVMAKSVNLMANGQKDKLYMEMLDRAHRQGVIDPQLLNEFIGHTSEMKTTIGDVMKGEEPFTNFLRSMSGWLPNKSERFARGQAFSTGYLIGKDILGLQDETLYQFSRKFTERTMFNYATQDRATLMTGPLGRTFGLFKNWQTHYIFSMLQYAEEGIKYGNWSPLLWQMGGTAAVGGVGALPLYGVADSFSKMATDQSAMANLYSMFGGTDPDATGGNFSDAVFMGLPAFLGVSLQGQATAPLNDPARDAAMLMSFPQWDRMRRLGQAVGGAIDTWATTGQHPITDPAIRDQFIAALAPKSLARSMQITSDNALRSLNTGNVILKDMSIAERYMWSVGLTPRRVGLAYEASDELWKDQNKRKSMTTNYGRAWAEAQLAQDWKKLEQLQQEVMVLGLDISTVTKSAASFREKKSTEVIERQFSPEARAKLQSLGLPGF